MPPSPVCSLYTARPQQLSKSTQGRQYLAWKSKPSAKNTPANNPSASLITEGTRLQLEATLMSA